MAMYLTHPSVHAVNGSCIEVARGLTLFHISKVVGVPATNEPNLHVSTYAVD